MAVAQENSVSLGLSQRVEFFQGDLLAPLKAKGELLNAIVSNPPYIPKADIATLAADVKAYEPMGALDGGEDGLDFYRRLLAESGDLLKEGGFLAMEVGIHQACQLEALAKDMSQWGKCEILRDLAGIAEETKQGTTILVPSANVHEARLNLATEGLSDWSYEPITKENLAETRRQAP